MPPTTPFPPITPQAYAPGSAAMGAGMYPNYGGPMGPNQYPPMNPNQYPPMNPNQYPPINPNAYPPAMNFNTGAGPPRPLPPYNPMPYPNMNSFPMMQRPASLYNSRPRYRRCRSCCSRPIVHIVEADSCSSISTCSSVSSCCYSIGCPVQEQPIIILPIEYQPAPTTVVPSNVSSAPIIIQPLQSAPQLVTAGNVQQIRAGPIQYVQATPKSRTSSELKFTPITVPSTFTPQRTSRNNTSRQQTTILKPTPRSASIY